MWPCAVRNRLRHVTRRSSAATVSRGTRRDQYVPLSGVSVRPDVRLGRCLVAWRSKELSDDTESGRRGEPHPRCCGSSDCRAGGGPGGVAPLLDAGRYLGAWARGDHSPTGVRVVAAFVVVLVALATLVVLARVGLWRQTFVSDRMIRVLAWVLAGFFLVHALTSFAEGWAGIMDEWWLYGPGGLVIGLLAVVVAGSGGARRRHRPHWTLPSH